MITVLTGGTGGAKFIDGLRQVISPDELTVIVNTGDDLNLWGLAVSPDIDSIVYVLSSLLSKERGWGVQSDTFLCLQTMARYGEPDWFKVGDRDLAMHILRSKIMGEGKTLAEATAEIAHKLGVSARVLPMSNDRIETRIQTPAGDLSFEEYFVKRRFQDEVIAVRFAGSEQARPAPGVLDSILFADAVVLAPSNPVTSIGPILAIAEIRQALRDTSAQVIAVSPIVGDAAVSGPAANLMASEGLPVSIAGVAQAYQDFLDVLVVDVADDERGKRLRHSELHVHSTNILMRSPADKVNLAREVLSQMAACAGSNQR
ncbi:MAG TPA: 2-phospho-L-lactate transferase [Terriglobales bacterium]|jgi:LPPG:FO 2-phospho-L-lactate transferase|nr:2-phospho-L-lactate transferase [Terriglobales bacterium]